ncbi:MAG TPA: DUF1707 and DUF4870 domain-containing protein [Actinopolymorphaceae bacterium]
MNEGALRVSDAERERAVDLLQQAYAEGRIDHAELDSRIGTALGAVSRADLAAALRGLPLRDSGVREVAPVPSASGHPVRPSGVERSWALFAHWSGVFSLFLIPLIIALTKGRESRFVRKQAWEATNFHLTYVGANIAVGVATALTFGLAGLLFLPLALVWLVLTGIGGLSAAVGNQWRYPWNVRLLG